MLPRKGKYCGIRLGGKELKIEMVRYPPNGGKELKTEMVRYPPNGGKELKIEMVRYRR
ncbi:MAG: hypothetical protein IPH56_08900 [Chitinophagaceae bacterium]|nr:hypothetical protein [Chitinophagaceae bacterium]